MIKIGLFGIQGVYNFGCEAIVRGAYKFINSVYPCCEIIYFSYSIEDDKKALKDLDIKIIPVKTNRSFIKRAFNKISTTIGCNRRFLLFDTDIIINGVDVIVSIGGDIYTIPEVLRKNNEYPYYNQLVDFCDRAIAKGKKVIVYGASVGPWGNYKKAVDYNVKALSKYKVILCREEESVDYLKNLGLTNVSFFPDPAFQIRGNNDATEKKYIGINLSPLSLKELYGEYNEEHIEGLSKLIDQIYDKTGKEIMFIPHVLSKSDNDNDLWFLQKIKDKMSKKEKVVFADCTKGFIGLKQDISKCYVVAAARMHCAVNAIDENVPAIFLAYSQKGVGMCKYIYGNDKYLIDLKDIDTRLVDVIQNALGEYKELSEYLVNRNIEIENYYNENVLKISL